ncbi:MAG TPA: DUF5680 domain-containing protein [Smithellaceae bacterium]|nr:DUF5680 domain-containing protein [Smithellaceae bacterium]
MDDLIKFIVEAKKSSYAAQGDTQSVTPLLPGTKQLEYRQGDFFYRDIYAGMLNFVGQEIVYLKEKPIWSMSYTGGLLLNMDKLQIMSIYSFLREAMNLVSPKHPFRGPEKYSNADYCYANSAKGKIDKFNGREAISKNGHELYELFYAGGMVI